MGPSPILWIATVVSAMLPDADVLSGLLAADIGAYHNKGAPSPVAGMSGGIWVLEWRQTGQTT